MSLTTKPHHCSNLICCPHQKNHLVSSRPSSSVFFNTHWFNVYSLLLPNWSMCPKIIQYWIVCFRHKFDSMLHGPIKWVDGHYTARSSYCPAGSSVIDWVPTGRICASVVTSWHLVHHRLIRWFFAQCTEWIDATANCSSFLFFAGLFIELFNWSGCSKLYVNNHLMLITIWITAKISLGVKITSKIKLDNPVSPNSYIINLPKKITNNGL